MGVPLLEKGKCEACRDLLQRSIIFRGDRCLDKTNLIQAALPVGQSDIGRTSTVKIFCPKCEDIYYPRSKLQGNIDGAYFGTTFPHLFLLTYPKARPSKALSTYTPRVFGFKLHASANNNHRDDKSDAKGKGRLASGSKSHR